MKKLALILGFVFVLGLSSEACTNYLVTKGASADGSTMISYAADNHVLYGELYHWPAAKYEEGVMMDIYEWDTGKFLGKIPQARETYNVTGNMNEFQLAIGETTYGGRPELAKQTGGIMDYGSLIYTTLQRAKNAREAIKTIDFLMQSYGYYSSGESFSIADKDEVWIMELIGKGEGHKGGVWVARLIPDGYVSGHANQARITTFDYQKENKWDDPKANTFNSPDVISFAKDKGWFTGKDKNFSFSDTYAPVAFGGARFCEIRVWSMFNKVVDGMDAYWNYVKGHIEHGEKLANGAKNKDGYATNRMPLWVKPTEKVSVHDMMMFMRDHLEGTELDMSKDLGAGPFGVPYRWRPLTWEVDGVRYCNERVTATQQSGFTFVSQSRSWLPDEVGGIIWWGLDDASSSVYVPLYSSMTKAPETFAEGNGAMMEWSENAAFWVFSQVANLAYTRYNAIHPEIAELQLKYETDFINTVPAIDATAVKLLEVDKALALNYLTDFSSSSADNLTYAWKKFYRYLFMKYHDGNVRTKKEKPDNYKIMNPDIKFPGYGEEYYRKIVKETGDKLRVIGADH